MQLGLKFPKADGAACIIDTSLYEASMLMPGPNAAGPYPLVVRLETITAKGISDGHTLQVYMTSHFKVLETPEPFP